MPQREKNIIIFPMIELKKIEKTLKVSSPKINEIKKPITINKLMINATPVILCSIESTEFWKDGTNQPDGSAPITRYSISKNHYPCETLK